jgi:hypothetical protein
LFHQKHSANAQPTASPAVNCSAENATIDFPTECGSQPTADPAEPVAAPSFNAAFSPVKAITSIAFGIGYGVLNILLIVGLVILIKCFKRKAAPKSKANAGV